MEIDPVSKGNNPFLYYPLLYFHGKHLVSNEKVFGYPLILYGHKAQHKSLSWSTFPKSSYCLLEPSYSDQVVNGQVVLKESVDRVSPSKI